MVGQRKCKSYRGGRRNPDMKIKYSLQYCRWELSYLINKTKAIGLICKMFVVKIYSFGSSGVMKKKILYRILIGVY